ncbi:HlyD family secretion protein [Acerihabitans arboris]|uniref:HlyD family efflux transporter periplasmic adaptor subunit n=1 Tax=Acerihabitans arboris TaxID=2691583 RepID=A0A845SLA6_9GAMM|nr:HlyD family secretion protein [Acerihabitans arboris]NDL64027.1 HlyD family efflux transporter periplasmic adaptor subunit [Acerihabitans arboris]
MSQQPDGPAPAPEKEKSSYARILTTLVAVAIAIVGVLVILYAWQLPPFTRQVQTTDNAYIRGQVTVISPQLSGYITGVYVQDFAWVRKGDRLMAIDERIYQQRVHQAMAQLDMKKAALANNIQQRRSSEAAIARNRATVTNAQAQAEKARLDLKRVQDLTSDGSLSVRERDASRASYSQATADIAQATAALEMSRQDLRTVIVNRASLAADVANAQAALELTQIDLANTQIVAPRDGQLGQISVRQGAYVSAGTHLTSLVPRQMWAIANMKETQMAGIRLGQPVSIRVDALDDARLDGEVENISPATGSEFSAISADNATGNFVKIAQRIPVRIKIHDDGRLYRRLRPGMSVEVSISTLNAENRQGEVR